MKLENHIERINRLEERLRLTEKELKRKNQEINNLKEEIAKAYAWINHG